MYRIKTVAVDRIEITEGDRTETVAEYRMKIF